MKTLVASLLFVATPGLLFAQAAPAKKEAAPKPAAKAAAPVAAKPATKAAATAKAPTKAPAKPKAAPKPSRTEIKSTASNVAAGIMAAEAALTPDELAIAQLVDVGVLPCELGNSVTITADAANPGYFNVQTRAAAYRMFPVVTSTGAIRLEDRRNGAVWLQLGNKSMLMNQRLGQRLADECQSPSQMAVAQSMRSNPAPNLLEPLPANTAYPTAPTAPAGVAPATPINPIYPTGPTPPARSVPARR